MKQVVKNEWSIGDIVRLRSGGPEMTVLEVSDGEILCQWYCEAAHVFADQTFPADALREAKS